MTRVFISYSRKDIEFVDRLAGDLKSAGFDVWYDLSGLEAGTRWGNEIQKAIQESQFFLVVLSPNSIISDWVEREFLFASDLNLKIIPLLYQQCKLPMWSLNLHFIDMQGKNYAPNFHELLKIMGEKSLLEEQNPIAIRYIEIGDEYRKRGQSSQAIESYMQALKVDPLNLKAQSNIGAIHLEEQEYVEAAAAFEQSLNISGEDSVAQAGWCNANLALGNQARADGKPEEAMSFYQRILKVHPDDANSRKSLAVILSGKAEELLTSGHEEEGLNALNEALKYTPEDTALNSRINNIHVERKARILSEFLQKSENELSVGNWEQAINTLNEALAIAPQDGSILKKIEQIQEKRLREQLESILSKVEQAELAERWDTALAGLNEFLKLKPDDKAVQKRMTALLETKRASWLAALNMRVDKLVTNRNWKEALSVLNEALQVEPGNAELRTRADQLQVEQLEAELNSVIIKVDQAAAAAHWDIAIDVLNTALMDHPDNKTFKAKIKAIEQSRREEKLQLAMRLADLSASAGKWQDAVAALNEVLTNEPDNPEFLEKLNQVMKMERESKLNVQLVKAQNLVKMERYEEALSLWNEHLKTTPEDRKVVLNEIEEVLKSQKLNELYSQAKTAYINKEYEQAHDLFQRVLEVQSDYRETRTFLTKMKKRLNPAEKPPRAGIRKLWILLSGLTFLALGIGAALIYLPGFKQKPADENLLPSTPVTLTHTLTPTLTPTITLTSLPTSTPTVTPTSTREPSWIDPILTSISLRDPNYFEEFEVSTYFLNLHPCWRSDFILGEMVIQGCHAWWMNWTTEFVLEMDFHFLSGATDVGGWGIELRGGESGDGVDIDFLPSGDVVCTDKDGDFLIPQAALPGESLNHIQIIISNENYALLINDLLVRRWTIDSKIMWRDGGFRIHVGDDMPTAFDNLKVWDLNALKPPN